MDPIKLPPRLRLIASLVGNGDVVFDVGTDHGLVPAWLLQNGICKRAIASDLKPGPLQRAKATAVRFGQEEKIEFLLCDGLNHISAGTADTIIIAGMGGQGIAKIIRDAHMLRAEVRLVLQPMTKQDQLRLWLYENGFEINGEYLVDGAGKIYNVIVAGFGKPGAKPSLVELIVGRGLAEDPLFSRYVDALIRRSRRACQGLSASCNKESIAKAKSLEIVIDRLLEMKER